MGGLNFCSLTPYIALVVAEVVVLVLVVVFTLFLLAILIVEGGMPVDDTVAVSVSVLKVNVIETLCPGVLYKDIFDIRKVYTNDIIVVLTPGTCVDAATDVPNVDVAIALASEFDG